MKLKYSNLDFRPKSIDESNYTLRAVFSTSDVDRHGEVVDQKSWLLDDFLKNPVLLFGHDHGQPPVGMVTGLGYNQDGNLEGDVKFAAQEYPFANVIWNLYKGGFMKAFSVGFSAGKVDIVDNQVILRENTLYEISTVSVPANAMALAKNKGLDVSALEEKMIEDKTKATGSDTLAPYACPDCGGMQICDCASPTADKNGMTCTDCGGLIECSCAPKKSADVHNEKDCPCKKKDDVVPPPAADVTPAPVAETPAPTEAAVETPIVLDAEEELAKTLDGIVQSMKEGRVLSSRNRTGLVNAVEAIQAVLEADKPAESKALADTTSTNTADVVIKVETPAARVVVSKKSNKARQINKAIRALLKEKSKR